MKCHKCIVAFGCANLRRMKKNGFLQFSIFLLLVVLVYVGHSQGNATQSIPSLVPNTPLDGGMFLLMAVGLVYGAKVLYRKD